MAESHYQVTINGRQRTIMIISFLTFLISISPNFRADPQTFSSYSKSEIRSAVFNCLKLSQGCADGSIGERSGTFCELRFGLVDQRSLGFVTKHTFCSKANCFVRDWVRSCRPILLSCMPSHSPHMPSRSPHMPSHSALMPSHSALMPSHSPHMPSHSALNR